MTFSIIFTLFRWAHFAAGVVPGKASFGKYPKWPVTGVQNLSICHTFYAQLHIFLPQAIFYPSEFHKLDNLFPSDSILSNFNSKIAFIFHVLMDNLKASNWDYNYKSSTNSTLHIFNA